MKRTFYKYQGTGNDFILFDDRENKFPETDEALIAQICHRRFGIGADGVILLRKEPGFDFRMVYVNSDGRPSSMCGNGGRCIARFAAETGIVSKDDIHFMAVDGAHEAIIGPKTVKLKMNDVHEVEAGADYFFLDTGSPHCIRFCANVPAIDVYNEGRKLRYSERFSKEGVNVNFAEPSSGGIFVRTYERGVENETLSCGTGVTAAALAAALKGIVTGDRCAVETPGGKLIVHFRRDGNSFKDIWLEGPAVFVFKGEIEV